MRSVVPDFALAALALAIAAGVGYSLAQRSARSIPPAQEAVAAGNDDAAHGDLPRRAHASTPVHAKQALSVPPADFSGLDGAEFVSALAQLEQRARDGDAKAARFVFDRLADCLSYSVEDDASLRTRIDGAILQQREQYRQIRSRHPQLRNDPRFEVTDAMQQAALHQAFDKRDRCAPLSTPQMESRFDMAKVALERHDRRAIIDFSLYFNVAGAELSRNTERLIELRHIERTQLDALVDAGDTDAMWAAASAYSKGGFLPEDPVLAYACAYAWQLADTSGNPASADQLMSQLAQDRLSPQQVDAARARGEAIYQHCCGARDPSSARKY
ncbi:MAG: hypothetical protein ABI082_11490 [Dokdonella sp.]